MELTAGLDQKLTENGNIKQETLPFLLQQEKKGLTIKQHM